MYLVCRDTISAVVRQDKTVSEFDEYAFEGEAVTGRLGIGTDGIVADENEPFGLWF